MTRQDLLQNRAQEMQKHANLSTWAILVLQNVIFGGPWVPKGDPWGPLGVPLAAPWAAWKPLGQPLGSRGAPKVSHLEPKWAQKRMK